MLSFYHRAWHEVGPWHTDDKLVIGVYPVTWRPYQMPLNTPLFILFIIHLSNKYLMEHLYSVLSIMRGTERDDRKTSQGLHHQGAENVVEQTEEHIPKFPIQSGVWWGSTKSDCVRVREDSRKTSLRSGGPGKGQGPREGDGDWERAD